MIERYVNAQFKSTKIEERGEIADQSTRQAGRPLPGGEIAK
jgi:hypothetical protein